MPGDRWPLIYFIRHGQTDWNKEQRFQGQRDIPLNDHGRSQAAGNGEILRRILAREGTNPDQLDWFCSPLDRTKETMKLVREQFDTELPEVTYDERLKEISFGTLEGVLLTEMQRDYPDEYAARIQSKWHHLPPEGENYELVLDRLSDFGRELQGPSIIVSHGGIARALRNFLADTPTAELNDWHARQDCVMRFADGRFDVLEN